MVVMAREVRIPTPEEIRAIRGTRSQAEVADIIGTSQSQWALWESGKRKPSRQSAILLNLLRRKKIR